MSTQADVKSIDTIAFVRSAFAAFAHETGQAVAELELQGQRAVDWITIDQAAHWKAEVRRAGDMVNKAIKDLEHCRAFKKVGDNTPSCIEEKKALEKARRRLEYAERKAEIVRRWTPTVQQQFRETCVRLVRFREVVDLDCPKAMARLEQMLKALEAYATAGGPRAGGGSTAAAAGGTMARPVDAAPPGTVPPPGAVPPTPPPSTSGAGG